MRQRFRPATVEWGFVVSLIVLFALLTVLQFRWTAQRSQSTVARLRGDFSERVRTLCQNFDAEMQDSCRLLLPPNGKIDDANRAEVHADLLRQWALGRHRPIFRRLAVLVPAGQGPQFYFLDQKTLRLTPGEWPPEWAALKQHFLDRSHAPGPPPLGDPGGALREFPVLGVSGKMSPPGEGEWMIFELDLEYLQRTWLPELIHQIIDPAGTFANEVVVRTVAEPARTLYASGPVQPPDGAMVVSGRLNTQTLQARGGEDGAVSSWIMTAWLQPGALEGAVSAARWRNLALVCLLNGLLVAAGVALLRYTQRSRELAAAQMRFVSTVSHELRTPLTVIRGAGQNLARGIVRDPAQIQQYGRLIIQHADQLTEIIEQMLESAHARKDAGLLEQVPVDLADVLEKAVAATLTETRTAGCKVEAHILSRLPRIKGNATALLRVFQNLITNAAKYGASGQWIGVSTEYRQTGPSPVIEVQVADRGPGIPASEQATIFEPFVRGSSADAAQIRGTGLGLSLVREIIEAHHGTITVQSSVGAGAKFTVRFPVPVPAAG